MMIAKKWTMAKGKRETPCQCAQPIRVKIVEPGIHIRRCELCKRRMTYLLEEMEMLPGVLKLRWITDKEATAWVAAQRVDVADVEVGGL